MKCSFPDTTCCPKIRLNLSLKEENLSNSPMFRNMPKEVVLALFQNGYTRKLKRGQYLFFDGEEVRRLYYVQTGRIREFYSPSQGREYLRRILMPGDYISLHQMLNEEHAYTYSCSALIETKLFAWNINEFRELLGKFPALALRVAQITSSCMEISCRQHCLCRKPKAIARVAGYILSKQDQIRRNLDFDGQTCIAVRTDLRPMESTAGELCLVRETFSRALSTLQKQGLIKLQRGIVEIVDRDGLREISELM